MNPQMHRILMFLRRLTVAGVTAILLWTIILMIFEEQFIYFPTKYPGGIYEDARLIPGMRDCWIKTEDGLTIHGWFAPAESAIATLVISHGNAGNISHRIPILRRLQRERLNVLMYDYRGYGRSEGSPNEEGIYRDARAAFDYALTIAGVHPAKIILWGTSLGGVAAVDVATRRAAAGLILESTFTSAQEMARVLYPFLPASVLVRSRFNSAEKIRTIRVPLLVMHGNLDSIIPFKLGRELFEAANEPKEFYEIVGADHNDTFVVGGDRYFQRIRAFAERALSSRNHPPLPLL